MWVALSGSRPGKSAWRKEALLSAFLLTSCCWFRPWCRNPASLDFQRDWKPQVLQFSSMASHSVRVVLPSHPAFWDWATSRLLFSSWCEAANSRLPRSYHGCRSNKFLFDMHSFYLTLMLWLRQCIVLLPEVMGYIKTKSQQNKLSTKFRILLYELLAKGFLGTSQRKLAIVIALCCLWELHSETLVLKLPCTWAMRTLKIYSKLSWKLLPCLLVIIVPERAIHSVGGENTSMVSPRCRLCLL